MSAKLTLILLVQSVFHVEVNCQCIGPVGTNNETAFSAERRERFYVNTADPAPCNGTINSWRYCFYNPKSINNDSIYSTSFAVYRAVGTDDISCYIRVSNITAVSWRGSEINRSQSFNCYNVSVNAFTIEAGDFVAACVYDDELTRQLNVVGEATGYSLMSDKRRCSENSLPSNILSNRLSLIESTILHLYATITDSTYTKPTTIPSWTTASEFHNNQTSDPVTWNIMASTSDTTSDVLQAPSSTTAYLTSILPSSGSQAESFIIVTAGSVGGGLIVLLLLVTFIATTVYFMLKKQKANNISNTVVYTDSEDNQHPESNIYINTNAAYKQTATANTELEVLYDNTDPVKGTNELQESTSTENWDSAKLNMEENVAYESSTATQISLRSNVAYYKFGLKVIHHEENDQDCDDKYDYI